MPKKLLEQVSILADGVSHVRLVPEGMRTEEVIQQFWIERAEKMAPKREGLALANAKAATDPKSRGRPRLDPTKDKVNALDILETENEQPS